MKLSHVSALVVFAGVGLAGCVSPEQQRVLDTSSCDSYGFARGSDGYANCMMQSKMTRDAAEREQMAQFWANDAANRRERERLAGLPPRRY